MEKRLLIAFVLSFLVLTVWRAINPAPRPSGQRLERFQPIENKEDMMISQAAFEEQPVMDKRKAPKVLSEAIEILENTKLRAEFSNVGGTLQKVIIKEHETSLPITNIIKIVEYAQDGFLLKDITNKSITYSLEKDGIRVIKQYTLSEDDYIISANVEIQNMSKMSRQINGNIEAFVLDVSRMDNKAKNSRDKTLFEYAVSTEEKIHRKASAFKFSPKNHKEETGHIKWVGFRDRYFCVLIKPQYQTQKYKITTQGEKKLILSVKASGRELVRGESLNYESLIFFGPQRLELLSSYKMEFEDMMKFSNWGILDGVSKIIYKLMNFIYRIIPNWGVCIILISLIIYGGMYPLTMKGMLSMKKMQSLQPKITKLREQHKSNPQKLNKEIMELYKTHKINPLGGCFPLLLQMPIFIGLYQVLWRSVSFKGASFLWIKDLSEPDRLFLFPFTLPVIGNELNILPILMVIVMAIQQRLSSKNMAVSDPSQIAQQKMMMTIFPLFLGFIFYKFASGLSLYFTVFYLLSTFTQWKMSKATKVPQ